MAKNTIEFLLSAKDKLSKPMGLASKSVKGLSKTVFSLKGALGGLAVGAVAKSFINAASTTEQLSIRLGVLLGSVGEGNRLFKEMSQFASEVPFKFEDIMESATALAGVMEGGTDEIKQWMPLIGDLAATTGLSIRQTTEQVQRMLSAGAASADMFRERGVLAMLGFQAGVSVSAEETKKRLLEAWQDPLSKFKGATSKLATSWTGIMSMISDKWFAIKNTIMDAGLMNYLKALASVVDGEMGKALGNAKMNSKAWAGTIINGIESILKAGAFFMDMISALSKAWNVVKMTFVATAGLILIGIQKMQKGVVSFLELFGDKFKARIESVKESITSMQKEIDANTESFLKSKQIVESPWAVEDIDNYIGKIRETKDELDKMAEANANATGGGRKESDFTSGEKTVLEQNAEANRLAQEKDKGTLQQKIVDLSGYYLTERELANIKYGQDLLDLENYYMLTNMSDEQYRLTKEAAEIKHQENLAQTRKLAIQGSFEFAQAIRKKDLAAGLSAGQQMLSNLSKTNKTAFKIQKALALAKAVVTLPSAVIQSFENGGGYPWGLIPAGLMLAAGLKNISDIKNSSYSGQAHSGLTNVPREGTYLLNKGERVIQPSQNKDLTSFLNGGQSETQGNVSIENLNISVLENATSAEALLNMPRSDIEEVIASKFIPALNVLASRGVIQDAIAQVEGV